MGPDCHSPPGRKVLGLRQPLEGFDAAILDINLGDGMVYQVAEILARRHVPFVFVTGYDADSVDSRFRGIPVLQKPVEREMLQRLFAQGTNRAMPGLARQDNRVRA